MVHLRKSAWKYETSQSGGAQVEIVVAIGAGKGTITLKDPRGASTKFGYASGGVGAGVGGKFSFGGATEDSASSGTIWMTNSFRGTELDIKDLVGVCMIAEASVGIGLGKSWTYLLLGIPHPMQRPGSFSAEVFWRLTEIGARVANNAAFEWLKKNYASVSPTSANAVLKMEGLTAGANIGAGVLGSFGLVWLERGEPLDMTPKTTHDGPSRFSPHDNPPRISIPDDVLFAFDKSFIKPTAYEDLHAAGLWMLKYPGRPVLIKGHTDSVGNWAYNMSLSKRRADAVKQWLISNGYAKGTPVDTQGLGESEPAMPNNTEKGREKNRRVEIIFLPYPKTVKWF